MVDFSAPSENEPIPSQRIPEKKVSEFSPIKPLPPVDVNGQRVMPDALKKQIETWRHHGKKILAAGNFSTLMSGGEKLLCIVSVDVEKIAAFAKSATAIDKQRAEADKQAQAGVVPIRPAQ